MSARNSRFGRGPRQKEEQCFVRRACWQRHWTDGARRRACSASKSATPRPSRHPRRPSRPKKAGTAAEVASVSGRSTAPPRGGFQGRRRQAGAQALDALIEPVWQPSRDRQANSQDATPPLRTTSRFWSAANAVDARSRYASGRSRSRGRLPGKYPPADSPAPPELDADRPTTQGGRQRLCTAVRDRIVRFPPALGRFPSPPGATNVVPPTRNARSLKWCVRLCSRTSPLST